MNYDLGYTKGETCNRDGCTGIIDEHYSDGGCSCHINPPCGYCETAREYCPECDWDGREEQLESIAASYPSQEQLDRWERDRNEQYARNDLFNKKFYLQIPAEEIEVRTVSHTHFSQKVEGVYPASMSDREIIDYVKSRYYYECFGGGRWEIFPGRGRFSWIQYTD